MGFMHRDTYNLQRAVDRARKEKKDEFYTQYVDIEKEVAAYTSYNKNTFNGKTIFCNCDDPFESNFFKFFAANFNVLKLKQLICTTYGGSPIAGEQLALTRIK